MSKPDNSVYVVSPTRDVTKAAHNVAHWKRFEVIPNNIVGGESIFDVIDSYVHESHLHLDDIVILAHDDIQLMCDKETFDYCLTPLNDKDAGFVGAAGTQLFNDSAIWWEGLSAQYPVTPLAGLVYHGNSMEDMHPTYFGPNNKREVVVMDGIFLAAKVKTWRAIRTARPSTFTGKWDFYDIYYTFQAHMRGLKNYVMPLNILHESPGDTSGRTSWHDNKEAFKVKYGKHLPKYIVKPT